MQGATYTKSDLDSRLFIANDAPNAWCAYLLRTNETWDPQELDFKTIWDGKGSSKYRGDFLFARKMPAEIGESYNQAIRDVLDELINVPYSIALVWLMVPDEAPSVDNIFAIPLWEKSSRKYQVAMDSRFEFGNQTGGEIKALKQVPAEKEINGNYSAIQFPTGSATGLRSGPSAMEFGLRLKNGELPIERHTEQVVNDSYISIPVSGEGCGCIRFDMGLMEQEDLMSFDLGQKFFYQNGSFTEFNFPVLRSGRANFKVACQVSLDPANMLNEKSGPLDAERPQRTYIAFKGKTEFVEFTATEEEETIFDSFYKTETGYNLRFKPHLESLHSQAEFNKYFATRNSARLVFCQKQTDSDDLYYTPAGDFNLEYHPEGLPDGWENNRAQLLTGLSGTESIGFQPKKEGHPGDLIRFSPYRPAFSPDFPIEEASADGTVIEPSLTAHAHTAWANIVASNGRPVQFFAQSEGATLYAKSDGSDGEFLNFFELGVNMPQELDFAVPLVPYAGIEIHDLMSDFGIQILSPIRKDEVAALASPSPLNTDTIINVTTPQGTIAKLNAIADWKEVVFAENTETADSEIGPNYLHFDGTAPAPDTNPDVVEESDPTPEFRFGFLNLTTQLKEAFQTNQQFLVATDSSNLGALFTTSDIEEIADGRAVFNNKMYINDWPFFTQTPLDEEDTGEYRNVLIFKFCQGTLYDRVTNPALWTNPANFNGTNNLNNVSVWLKNYFDTALSQTDKYYEHFNKTLNDPNWNGILALKLDLEADNFPDNLKGLLAGIDMNELNIHHFGIEINRVDTSGELKINDNSSLFGLIDYQDADYRTQIQNPNFPDGGGVNLEHDDAVTNMPVQDDRHPYDFRVLTLRVLFENSDIKDFASKIQVTLNNLMKDQVVKLKIEDIGSIDSASLSDPNGDPNDLTYSLILDGTYDERDGKSVYTFSSVNSNKFYLDSNIINYFEIERALFETLSTENDHIETLFRFHGNINFKILKDDPASSEASLDIFSFGSENGNEDIDIGKGLHFSNLYLEMEFDLGSDDPADFLMDYRDFSFSIQKSYSRLEALFSKFPIDYQGFIFGNDDRLPDSMGYLTVDTPDVALDGVSGDWFGLKYKISLGTMGNLASSAGLEAKILVAWSASDSASDSNYQAFLGISLPGAGGDSKMFNLQGLLNLAIDTIEMQYLPNSNDKGAYVLRLNDIGFKFLGLAKLPLDSSTSFHLFANSNDEETSKNLGWLLAHGQEKEIGPVSLPLLAMGQRVQLDAGGIENMTQAIEAMQGAFFPDPDTEWEVNLNNFILGEEETNGGSDSGLQMTFNDESNWLIAFKFGFMGEIPKEEEVEEEEDNNDNDNNDNNGTNTNDTGDDNTNKKKKKTLTTSSFAIELAVLFNDPDIYGARLSLGGDLVSVFDGLEFEILYTKVTDSIGRYHIEFVLPSEFRSFKAGAAGFSLPGLLLDIYTNGNFYVDLGFPHDVDFSNSFSVEVQAGPFPLVGSGGFYFGKLTGETAKGTRLPVPVSGKFDPVFLFGLGLEVGFGKSFEKGPLTAGFKITLVGIIEGIVATYIPEQIPAESSKSKDLANSHFYLIDGTFGIVGILEGEVDFEIIKASVYVEVYALVNAVFEAYKAIPITLKAGVEVAVSVEIDVFVGTITIDFSFDTEIKETFVIGKDTSSQAPWNQPAGLVAGMQAASMVAFSSPDMQLQSDLKVNNTPVALDLFWTLQSTVGDDAPSLVNMLMIASPDVRDEASIGTAFDNLSLDIFEWIIRSLKASANDEETVTKTDLETAIEFLNNNSISQTELDTFLANNYAIKIKMLENRENCPNPTLFPMFPSMALEMQHSETTITTDDDGNVISDVIPGSDRRVLNAYSSTTREYLNSLNNYFKNPASVDGNTAIPTAEDPSLAQWIYEDYFKIIGKHLLREALDLTSETTTVSDLLTTLSNNRATAPLSGMIARYLMGGLRLPVLTGLVVEDENIVPGSDYGIYRLTGQQFALPQIPETPTFLTNLSMVVKSNADFVKLAETVVNEETGVSVDNELTVLQVDYDQTKINDLINDLNAGTPSAGFGETISALPATRAVAKRYKFKSFLPWTNTENISLALSDGSSEDIKDFILWQFSDSLLNHLSETDTKDFDLKIGSFDELNNNMIYQEPDFKTYGTLVDLTIKRKEVGQAVEESEENAETGQPNFKYELIGTDEIGITLLERLLLNGSVNGSNLQILYNNEVLDENGEGTGEQNTKQLASLDINTLYTFINRVNLSTETNPIGGLAAAMMALGEEEDTALPKGILNDTASEFVRFIWEASILRTGGYYLFYQDEVGETGLPNYIFNDDQTAHLKILIPFYGFTQPANYMNCALTKTQVETFNLAIDDVQVFLEANHLQQNVALLPQSEIGLLITRDNPDNPIAGDDDYFKDYLTNLYHLLAYQVTNASTTDENGTTTTSSDFKEGNMSVPVGPTRDLDMENPENNVAVTPESLDEWHYKLSIALHRFAKANPNVTLLENAANPYAGIDALSDLKFCWRDLYGNCALGDFTLSSSEKTILPDNTTTDDGTTTSNPFGPIQLGYSDKLIPVNQWPYVGTNYNFNLIEVENELGGTTLEPHLVIHFDFNPPDFSEETRAGDQNYFTEMMARVAKIYYQISQTDGTTNHVTGTVNSTFFKQAVETVDGEETLIEEEGYKYDLNPHFPALQTFLSNIYNFLADSFEHLNDEENVAPPAIPGDLDIQIPLSVIERNTAGLFELNVEVLFERNQDFVDSAFLNSAEVLKANSKIQPKLNIVPQTDEEGNNIQKNRLKEFATHFETIFASEKLKIATGINKEDLNTNKKAKDIWVADMSQLDATITTGNPLYYALPPLSTKLESKTVSLFNYKTGDSWGTANPNITEQGSDESDEAYQVRIEEWNALFSDVNFSEIDMDVWAQQFLEAVDTFLSPEMTTAAYLVDKIVGTTHLEEIMAAKDTLATNIVGFLTTVFNDNAGETALDIAKEKLRQQLLIKLNNAYLVNAVVQFPVTTTGFDQRQARLYGRPVIQNGGKSGDRNFAFSTAKIDVVGSSDFLTFLFDTRHDAASPAVEFDLDYQITHIEFDIKKHDDDELTGYESSSWLAFVCPQTAILDENGTPDPATDHLKKDLGFLEIPVVLRAYPTPPSLQGQRAIQSDIEGEKSALLNATQWDYHFTYLQNVAAQDIVKAQVAFNLRPPEVTSPMNLNSRDLFDELATFITLYPAVHKDLFEILPTITALTDPAAEELHTALDALDTFKHLVQNVAAVWAAWVPGSSSVPASEPLEGDIQYNFHIREDSADNTDEGPLLINVETVGLSQKDEKGNVVNPPKVVLDIPNIEINDTKGIVESEEADAQTRKYENLTFGSSRSISERTVVVENLNILELQNVISQITLTRNEELVSGKSTNDAFVYKTPMVKFPNKLVPLLDNRQPVNIWEEVNGTDDKWTLAEYLKAFFEKLLDKQKDEDFQTIKLECSYAYQIQAGSSLPEIKLPILLTPPTDFTITKDSTSSDQAIDFDINDPTSFVSKLASNIENWFVENQPSDANAGERFLFDLAVFSKIEESRMPIVRLRNVFLSRDDIA